MTYTGSKGRIAKDIIPIMEKVRNGRIWVEPFVGGANLIDKVKGERIGADSNHYVIALLQKVQSGWLPPADISEWQYNEMRDAPELYDPALIGFALTACSFGAKWGSSFARGFSKRGVPHNYTIRGRNNLAAQAPFLQGIKFVHSSYDVLDIPENSLIYCDPPYAKTCKYKDAFDHIKFWDWARQKSVEGFPLFVSEYEAPEDFIPVWQKEVPVTLNNQGTSDKRSAVEKLFIHCELL